MLDRDSILELLDSDEAKNFFLLRNSISSKNPDLHALKESLMCYQLKIEDSIIRKFSFIDDKTEEGSKKSLEIKYSNGFDWLGTGVTIASAFFTAIELFSFLGLVFIKPVKEIVFGNEIEKEVKKIKLSLGERDWERDKILEQLQNEDVERIKAEGQTTNRGSDTLYL